MTRSTTFKGLLAATAAAALSYRYDGNGRNGTNETESRNWKHCACARRMGRWVKLVESHSVASSSRPACGGRTSPVNLPC